MGSFVSNRKSSLDGMLTVEHHSPMMMHMGSMHCHMGHQAAAQPLQSLDSEEGTTFCDGRGPQELSPSYFDEDDEDSSETTDDWKGQS